MNGKLVSIKSEFQIGLTSRELELLNHICSYGVGHKEFAESRISSSHYNGGVSVKDIEEFMQNMRNLTKELSDTANQAPVCRIN